MPDGSGQQQVSRHGLETCDSIIPSYAVGTRQAPTRPPGSQPGAQPQYRFPGEPANCGILIRSSTPRVLSNRFAASIEVQMNSGHVGHFWCIGENIEVSCMEAGDRDLRIKVGRAASGCPVGILADDSEKPLGEWNTMQVESVGNEVRLQVNGNHVKHGFNRTVSEGKLTTQTEEADVDSKNGTHPAAVIMA